MLPFLLHNRNRSSFSIASTFSIARIYGSSDEKEKETMSKLSQSALASSLPRLFCIICPSVR